MVSLCAVDVGEYLLEADDLGTPVAAQFCMRASHILMCQNVYIYIYI